MRSPGHPIGRPGLLVSGRGLQALARKCGEPLRRSRDQRQRDGDGPGGNTTRGPRRGRTSRRALAVVRSSPPRRSPHEPVGPRVSSSRRTRSGVPASGSDPRTLVLGPSPVRGPFRVLHLRLGASRCAPWRPVEVSQCCSRPARETLPARSAAVEGFGATHRQVTGLPPVVHSFSTELVHPARHCAPPAHAPPVPRPAVPTPRARRSVASGQTRRAPRWSSTRT